MSVYVTIKTSKTLKTKDLFDCLSRNGEQIFVTSEDFPFLKFGTCFEALRGIEVNKERGGYEVRVCTYASIADYRLFAKTIQTLMTLTKGRVYDEDGDEMENPLELFDEEWIDSQREQGYNLTHALIENSGKPIIMDGLICKICIGPKLYKEFGMTRSYSKEDMDALQNYLCSIQWHLAGLNDTSTRMMLPAPSGNLEDGLSVSMISIRDGKVDDFDYVSEASLLGIVDMDNEAVPPVLFPFGEAWKVLPSEVFRPLDELQFKREEGLTVEMVRGIMESARRLQPDDLHHKSLSPGEGFDETQNTVILMWNPAISSVTLEDHRQGIENMLTAYFNWSVWEHDRAKCGDRFFLVRVGEGKTGIVMSGVFDTHPYEDTDWSGKGRRTYYTDMLPNTILDPEIAPMLTTDELCEAIPSFDWRGGHSGRLLTKEEAKKMESLWERYLQKVSLTADGKALNILNRRNLVFEG